MTTVLFVCTGNTCRSPMAEGYLKHKNINNVSVLSAGIYADKSPVSHNAKIVCEKYGIDISRHISTPLTPKMIDSADYIVCMSHSHKQFLNGITSENKKLFVLSDGVPDPFGADLAVYEDCFLKIKSAVDDFCERYL